MKKVSDKRLINKDCHNAMIYIDEPCLHLETNTNNPSENPAMQSEEMSTHPLELCLKADIFLLIRPGDEILPDRCRLGGYWQHNVLGRPASHDYQQDHITH